MAVPVRCTCHQWWLSISDANFQSPAMYSNTTFLPSYEGQLAFLLDQSCYQWRGKETGLHVPSSSQPDLKSKWCTPDHGSQKIESVPFRGMISANGRDDWRIPYLLHRTPRCMPVGIQQWVLEVKKRVVKLNVPRLLAKNSCLEWRISPVQPCPTVREPSRAESRSVIRATLFDCQSMAPPGKTRTIWSVSSWPSMIKFLVRKSAPIVAWWFAYDMKGESKLAGDPSMCRLKPNGRERAPCTGSKIFCWRTAAEDSSCPPCAHGVRKSVKHSTYAHACYTCSPYLFFVQALLLGYSRDTHTSQNTFFFKKIN